MTTPPRQPLLDGPNLILDADALTTARTLPPATFTVAYLDPPWATGTTQHGRDHTYPDPARDDYTTWLLTHVLACWPLLTPDGTLYLHLPPTRAHHIRPHLDRHLGAGNFLAEIIWAYDWGGRARDRWAAKHDTILMYARSAGQHVWNVDELDRIPYLAPEWGSAERAARGKVPTDVWWHTIVPTRGRERTGYPSQKPEPLLRRMIRASSRPGDWVVDLFAGSGTTGAAAADTGRRFVLADINPAAHHVMSTRLNLPVTRPCTP